MLKSTTAFFINKDMEHLFNFKKFNEGGMYGEDVDLCYTLLAATRFYDFLKEEGITHAIIDSEKLKKMKKTGLFDDDKITEWFEEGNLGVESLDDLIADLKKYNLNLADLKDCLAEITDEFASNKEEIAAEVTERLKEGYTFYTYCNLDGYHAVILMKRDLNLNAFIECKPIESVQQIVEEF